MIKTVRPLTYARITAHPATIRETATDTGRELGSLNYGELVQVLEDLTAWLAVPFAGGVAFIADSEAEIIAEW